MGGIPTPNGGFLPVYLTGGGADHCRIFLLHPTTNAFCRQPTAARRHSLPLCRKFGAGRFPMPADAVPFVLGIADVRPRRFTPQAARQSEERAACVKSNAANKSDSFMGPAPQGAHAAVPCCRPSVSKIPVPAHGRHQRPGKIESAQALHKRSLPEKHSRQASYMLTAQSADISSAKYAKIARLCRHNESAH